MKINTQLKEASMCVSEVASVQSLNAMKSGTVIGEKKKKRT